MKNTKVSIHDISKSLGINSSTVSRALSGSTLVSEKTRKRIEEKAKEMGYQRNSLASRLRTSRSNTIGVIVPRISRHFFSSVISGIEETAYKAGYDVVISQSLESLQRERKGIETFFANRVDGILISVSMETENGDHFKNYMENGSPIVFFDRPFEPEENTNVIIDDYKAAFKATEHLIEIGCENIVHFAGPNNLELYQRRLNGYKGALEKHGIKVQEDYILESRLMPEDGVENAKKLLKLPKVDGVFSANDTAAISAMQYLKEKGVKIPEEIAFVGFSNEPVAAVMEPSLTTISQSPTQIGEIATSLLIDQIKSEKVVTETKIIEPELIIRNSTKRTK